MHRDPRLLYVLRLIVRQNFTFLPVLFFMSRRRYFPHRRLVIINNMKNEMVNASVTSALKTLREKYPGYLGNVWTVLINETDATEIIDTICGVWNLAISTGGTAVPDLVLDATMASISAEVSSSFTAALGLPTLSAQYGQEGDIQYWRNLDIDQRGYLIQVRCSRVKELVSRSLSFECSFVSSLICIYNCN